MFYYLPDHNLLPRLPKNLIKSDGNLFINFNISDANTLSDYGYYTVRSDNNYPPTPNSVEDTENRVISIAKPYVDITRTWIDNKTINTTEIV